MKKIDTDTFISELKKRHISLLIKARQDWYLSSFIDILGLIRISDVEEVLKTLPDYDTEK